MKKILVALFSLCSFLKSNSQIYKDSISFIIKDIKNSSDFSYGFINISEAADQIIIGNQHKGSFKVYSVPITWQDHTHPRVSITRVPLPQKKLLKSGRLFITTFFHDGQTGFINLSNTGIYLLDSNYQTQYFLPTKGHYGHFINIGLTYFAFENYYQAKNGEQIGYLRFELDKDRKSILSIDSGRMTLPSSSAIFTLDPVNVFTGTGDKIILGSFFDNYIIEYDQQLTPLQQLTFPLEKGNYQKDLDTMRAMIANRNATYSNTIKMIEKYPYYNNYEFSSDSLLLISNTSGACYLFNYATQKPVSTSIFNQFKGLNIDQYKFKNNQVFLYRFKGEKETTQLKAIRKEPLNITIYKL